MSAALPDLAAADGRAARPSPGLWPLVKWLLKPAASLQLTVALFALSVVLVFFGTVAQKHAGIWTVVDQYFWSWVVFIDPNLGLDFTRIFFGFPATSTTFPEWLRLPFPGGKLLGGLMFFNLLAAHLVRMKLSWKRLGIVTLHSGMVLLFVSEYITREFQVEQQMVIPEGGSANYAVDNRHAELAFTTPSADGTSDDVTVVPASFLRRAKESGEKISHPDLPVDVEVKEFYRNSDLEDIAAGDAKPNPATVGIGQKVRATEKPEISGTDPDQKFDAPAAYVTLYPKGQAEPLATYMLTTWMDRPQVVPLDGKEWMVALRFVRYYKPFELHLKDFRFDRFVGTNTAKNYSSDVRLVDAEYGQDRELTIRMNEPLRHRGETFYQSSFTPDEASTILQVVRNPGWVLPYLSCAMVTVGMLLHFGLNLGSYLSKARARSAAEAVPERAAAAHWIIPAAAVLIAGLYVAAAAAPKGDRSAFPLAEVARLPVVEHGRVKPLDTMARVDLRLINHSEQFKTEGGVTRSAVEWFLDAASGTATDSGPAGKYKIFRIENDQVLDFFKLKRREGLRYSYEEMEPRLPAFREAANKANQRRKKGAADLNLFELHAMELAKHLELYLDVWHGEAPLLLPPGGGLAWRAPEPPREAVVERLRGKAADLNLPPTPDQMTPEQQRQFRTLIDESFADAARTEPASAAWHGMLSAWRTNSPADFRKHLADYQAIVHDGVAPADRARAGFEVYLNEFAPYYVCTALYAFAGLLTLAGWMSVVGNPRWGEGFRRAAFRVLLLTFVLHVLTLAARMYLMDRPLVFVTNLYSSAVFIGLAAAGICLLLERIYPITIGNAVAAALGFGTCVIAHNLAASGDTLEMMQAVLDTNFWLATHVTTVTLGYSATYIAGAIGAVYVVLGTFTTLLRTPVRHGARPSDLGKVLGQMLYGIVCLATMLSFVGTVLGGIWADQSWGRFWGWDPKENGAVLIVLWNAMILHARWCGLVKDRGVAVLALGGNMVTTWSWFGTNQLGVGLHAYGFSNTLATGCAVAWVLHAAVIMLGLVPTRYWASAGYAPAAKG